MVVKGSVKHNIPKHIMIASANLDLGKTIGQGMNVYSFAAQLAHPRTASFPVH